MYMHTTRNNTFTQCCEFVSCVTLPWPDRVTLLHTLESVYSPKTTVVMREQLTLCELGQASEECNTYLLLHNVNMIRDYRYGLGVLPISHQEMC